MHSQPSARELSSVCSLCYHEIKWHYHDPAQVGSRNGVYPCECTDIVTGDVCGCIALPFRVGAPVIANDYNRYPYCQNCAVVGKTTNDWSVINWIATCNVCGFRVDIASPVSHPKHYTEHPSGIECIQITEHMNYCLGNAIKYIWRSGLKSDDPIQDLEKSV